MGILCVLQRWTFGLSEMCAVKGFPRKLAEVPCVLQGGAFAKSFKFAWPANRGAKNLLGVCVCLQGWTHGDSPVKMNNYGRSDTHINLLLTCTV